MSVLTQSRQGPWSHIATLLRITSIAVTLLLFAAAIAVGQQVLIYLSLLFALPLALLCIVISRGFAALRRRITLDLLRHPFRRESRRLLLQFVNRTLCYGSVTAAVLLAVPAFVAPDDQWAAIIAFFAVVPAVLLIIVELFPARPVRLSYNLLFLALSLYLGVQFMQVFLAPMFFDPVTLAPPFRGEWVVFQGGRSTLLNHHFPIRGQRHALDLTLRDAPRRDAVQPEKLQDYATFGQPIYAPVDGKVERAVGDRPDQQIGTTDLEQLVGNHVVIEMDDGRCVLLAHLQHDSVRVKEGQLVRTGDLIARCGNSGNTSEPHLHIQVQSRIEWRADDLETWPIRFTDVTHIRWGWSHDEQQGELMRNDRILTHDTARD